MTKEDFITRLINQFSGMVANANRSTEKEIEGHKVRMDAEGFNTWLRAEQAAALQTPALKVFDTVLRASMGTPEDAAQSLTSLISIDHGGKVVDWQEQFKQAAPIISNWQPEQSDSWKYRGTFAQYIQAMQADGRAKVFSDYLGQGWPAGSILAKFGEGETEALAFRGEVIRRGNAYFLLWDECKETFGNANLPEREFILSDIDLCEEEIERWKDKDHSFRNTWIGILKASIRAHRERLEVLEQETAQAKPETEFFESIKAMEKALAAARHAGLINEGDKWKFTGYKTHAVSLFWVAAIAAGLAKPTAPVSKVSPFLEKIFNVPLGLNAINKKKKAEEYDRGTEDNVYQRLYNELLTQMGK